MVTFHMSLVGSDDVFHLAMEALKRTPWTSPVCTPRVF